MSLDHPFLLKMHYSFQCKANLYLMLDYEGGGTLFYHLKRKERLTEQEIVFYASEIILALEYLHSKQIIYRDLKPENVLLSQDGHIKLADFGLCKKLGVAVNETTTDTLSTKSKTVDNHKVPDINDLKPAPLGKTFSVCGTPQYMSPEVLAEKGHDMQSDWWALGIVIFELASGSPPFQCNDLEAMADNIRFGDLPSREYFSDDLEDLIQRLTHKLPERRLG